MAINPEGSNIDWLVHFIQHYNPKRYWRYREKVVNPQDKTCKLFKFLMLFYIKYCDAYNNASMGTNINTGAYYKTPPDLPHGLNGIIVHYKARFGENCRIYQQVTIGGKNGKAAEFGDNVIIGSGAKVIGGVTVGNNVIIGANAVITKDVPDDTIVVGAPNRYIPRKDK